MSDNIFDKAVFDFEKKTGERAKFLYLGQDEWVFLKNNTLAMSGFDYAKIEDPQYMGLKVLRVNRASHLAVS